MMSLEEIEKTVILKKEVGNLISVTFTQYLAEQESSEQANLVVGKIEEILKNNPEIGFNLIFDLSPIKILPSFITNESQEKYRGLAEHKQVRKVAIIGANLFFKVATNFLMTASRRGTSIKWFSNREEALNWFSKV